MAAEHDLIIISDEIYRDLIHDPDQAFASPVLFAPERTVVTTALSKSLALGGWRIGVARLPDSGIGPVLRDRLIGIGSEIWSAPSLPIQQAAALAFDEPAELTERVDRSRVLHAEVAAAVADRFAAAGLLVPAPQAAFYLYPDFAPWAGASADHAGHQQWRGPGHAPAALLWHGRAARERVRRGAGGPADAGGHRDALRRDRRAAGTGVAVR